MKPTNKAPISKGAFKFMTDTELFELCKEVSAKFPDWDVSKLVHKPYALSASLDKNNVGYVPLYTSDYLLEKLQSIVDIQLYNDDSSWSAYGRKHNIIRNADTPLKALLKLTLALKEAGVEI